MLFKYFNPVEDPKIVGIQDHTMLMLDSARDISGVPYIITCGLRTADHNAELKGAVCDSAHLTGEALDLVCEDDHTLFKMLEGLIGGGFTRIGIYVKPDPNNLIKLTPVHLHVDCDTKKPPEVTWILIEQN